MTHRRKQVEAALREFFERNGYSGEKASPWKRAKIAPTPRPRATTGPPRAGVSGVAAWIEVNRYTGRGTRRPRESEEQRAVVQWLRARGHPCHATINETLLSYMAGKVNTYRLMATLRGMGMVDGWPDLELDVPSPKTGRMVYVEMKRQRGPRGGTGGSGVSDSQARVHDEIRERGDHVIVGWGAEDAIAKLVDLGY